MNQAALHRTIWRWHFYAGLFVAPFLLILAVTGSIYLFKDEINDRAYPDLRFTEAPVSRAYPASRLLAAVNAAHPAAVVTRIDLPSDPRRTAEVFVTVPGQGERRVFVDPGTARIRGEHAYGRTLVGVADLMHGSLLLGWVGDRVVELAACWAVVLILSGLFLWWPRGANTLFKALTPQLRAKGRPFWRSLHAVTGAYTAALVLFLVMTGLPWAGLWGDLLTRVNNAAGGGYPARLWDEAPKSGLSMGQAIPGASWTLQGAPMPASHGGHHGHGTLGPGSPGRDVGVDAVVETARELGLEGGYRLHLPTAPDGVYTVFRTPDRPEGQRALHVDRYSGAVLADVSFADYGAGAKAVEWGISLHMGRYFGLANKLVMLGACLGVITLTVTGAVMWWRRRPRGAFGAPTRLEGDIPLAAPLVMAALGVVFPLVGASLMAVLAVEFAVRRARFAVRGAS